MVLVRHALCSLDGEAVEVSREARSPAPCAHASDYDALSAAHEQDAVDGHNHCELAVDRSSRLALTPVVAVVVQASSPVGIDPAPVSVNLAPGAGVLHFAPKTSPPA